MRRARQAGRAGPRGDDPERYRTRSLWLDQMPVETLAPRPALDGDRRADVVVVGAGFTGLWTALELLERSPALDVVVVDAEIAGFGASGRNGGWCSALLPMSFEAVARSHGVAATTDLWAAMVDTVDEVGAKAAALGIDCGFHKGGTMTLARSARQAATLQDGLAAHRRAGRPGDLRWLDAAEASAAVAASNVRGALFTPDCAVVHPARLVRGLASAAERAGGRIFERTPVTSIEAGTIRSPLGTIRARAVVRCTEGFTPTLAGSRRDLAPVYSLMIATEPLTEALWSEIGLADRQTFTDARRLIIYGQRTADGRLAFGGRGAPYHLGSSVRDEHDRHDATHLALRAILVDLFPMLADTAVTHAWGGPLGVARDWRCSVGFDRDTGIGWAGGYVGDGVACSNLAGRTLADLVLGRETALTRLPWVGHRSPRWPIEPARWLGINAAARLPGIADRGDAAPAPPPSAKLAGALLDRLTGH